MSIKDHFITGISYLLSPAKRKLIGYSYGLHGKKGLEIGGPSPLFSSKGNFPVYLFAQQVDGVNFSTETVWEGSIREGDAYRYYTGKNGIQFIKEATDLNQIPDESYDFVLSCHSLEHTANPLQAISEWKRILKPGGLFVLVLPDKQYTFDEKRPYTTMEHLLQDYRNKVTESDPTHFAEVIATHIPELDPQRKTVAELTRAVHDNVKNRQLHHHVFSLDLVKEMLTFFSFRLIHQQTAKPFHLITLAEKTT